MKIDDPTPKTAILAKCQLLIAQTHLLELAKQETPAGPACKAVALVAEAVDLLDEIAGPTEQ